MSKLRPIGAVVIGVLAIAIGLYLQFFPNGEVLCGTDVMTDGDLCETTRRGVTRTYTFAEMQEQEGQTPFLLMGFGALAIGYGIWQLRRLAKRNAAAQAPTTAAPSA